MAGIRIRSKLVAKSGRAEILKMLFWTGISEILAKILHTSIQQRCRLVIGTLKTFAIQYIEYNVHISLMI